MTNGRLCDDQLTAFERDGFLVLPNFIDDAERGVRGCSPSSSRSAR